MTVREEVSVSPHHQSLRDAAIGYAERGWPVIRIYGLRTNASGRLVCACRNGLSMKCKDPGKHPAEGVGFLHRHPPSPETVAEWWDRRPGMNVGIATGGAFGIVIDIDPARKGKPDGEILWAELQDRHGPAPDTLTIRTGSGGRHLIYREPPGHHTGNTLPGIPPSRGIDVRGNGGFIVTAPSLHECGAHYAVANDLPVAEAPSWVYDKASPTSSLNRSRRRIEPKHATPRLARTAPVEMTPDIKAKYDELIRGNPSAELPERDLRDFRSARAGDQSALMYRLCLRAVSAGYGAERLINELIDVGNHGTYSVRQRLDGRYGEDWVVRTIRKAYEQIATELVALDHVETLALQHDWQHTTFTNPRGKVETVRANTLSAVMMASIEFAKQRTTIEPMLGKIELARATGYTEKTVRKAMHALEDGGWIETITQRDRTATIYRLHAVPRQ